MAERSGGYSPQFERLGSILVKEGFITQEQLDRSLAEQKKVKKKLGDVLVDLELLTGRKIIQALAKQMGIAAVGDDELLEADEKIVSLIPESFARDNNLIALRRHDNVLRVAMIDPDDIVALDNLSKLTKLQVEPVIATKDGISKAIERLYVRVRKSGEVSELMEDLRFFGETEEGEEEGEIDMSQMPADLADAPIVKLVNMMLVEAIRERATDIHIETTQESMVVRLRVDGVLREVMAVPKSSLPGVVSRIKILSRLNIAEHRLPQDGRFTVRSPEKDLDIRVSVLPTVFGEKIVLRLLDKTGFSMDLTQLGFEQRMLSIFRKWIVQPYGMIIIAGPTGSGKSTTMHAALQEIKSTEINITTVEDPVEYQQDGINQVQVKEKIGLTFASTLKFILRQDPDILLIGEIRDAETADIAVKFSLTGHLVFSTLHANDAPSTITRLLDIGVPPFLVGSCLNLVMSQRLVRTICPHCKESYRPSVAELEMLDLDPSEHKETLFYLSKGCVHCRNTGYFGRTGIFEILEIKQPIRRLIYDNANLEDVREKALSLGMITLRDSGIRKVIEGITTVKEVLRSTIQE
ncbi:Flp pilus assembly complex ATPase component TadA [candidate division KSB1 bacterium]|nr:Flp pilus assembly complex ATPase component TadA [candidate division KSB1 bacterium]